MSSGDPVTVPPERLMTLRVIHAALLMGCASFGVVAYFMRQQQGPPPAKPIISYVGILFAVTTAMAFVAAPALVLPAWRRRVVQEEMVGANDSFLGMFQTLFIVRASLLEGTIFLQLLAYLIEGEWWTLGVAGLFFLGMALMFPTEERIRRWIETQREAIEQMRRDSGSGS